MDREITTAIPLSQYVRCTRLPPASLMAMHPPILREGARLLRMIAGWGRTYHSEPAYE